MKLKQITTICLLASGLAVARAQDVKLSIPGQSAQPAAAPAKPAFTEAQILEVFGWFIGKRVGLTELEFSKTELETLVKGFMQAAEGKESPYELEKIGPQMDELMQKKQAVYLGKLKNKNTATTTEFFNKLKENKAVVEQPSGLRYEILKPGEGAFPKPSDTVQVHYVGKLLDGTEFDSSVKRGKPADFQLDQVIPGWTEGIQKVNKGGKIKLYVPPHLGYGDEGNQGIPPGSTLIFEVELLDIKSGAAPAMPAMPTKK
ncbi:MAG: FKBP-type peptidyl-prolyl cis-trans isomerase [Opitutus sp.]|nr:FKBP-type peptidyl-prolyl cis-trans isomerase [Opitutus sp.]